MNALKIKKFILACQDVELGGFTDRPRDMYFIPVSQISTCSNFVLYATFFVAPAFILPAIHLVFIHKPNARHVAGYFNRPMLKRDD
ncbi:unnamed protein product [Gordionus sp. m RMFG-2023]